MEDASLDLLINPKMLNDELCNESNSDEFIEEEKNIILNFELKEQESVNYNYNYIIKDLKRKLKNYGFIIVSTDKIKKSHHISNKNQKKNLNKQKVELKFICDRLERLLDIKDDDVNTNSNKLNEDFYCKSAPCSPR